MESDSIALQRRIVDILKKNNVDFSRKTFPERVWKLLEPLRKEFRELSE